jgi:tRNA dimethylallyltransferase
MSENRSGFNRGRPVTRDLIRAIDRERPVLIAGPTASGKSALAMEIAEARGGVVVNADALQIYTCWQVLTARPSRDDEARVPHRLYGHVDGDEAYSVGAWLRQLAPLLRGDRPILVGGTGLYFTRLTEGLTEIPAIAAEIRREAACRDVEDLLGEIEPRTADVIDRRNPARVRRAWEVQRATGRSLAAWQADTPAPLLRLRQTHPLLLATDRDALARRIDARARRILADGGVAEVRAALARHGADAPAMKAIGAREIAAHLRGELTREEALERLVVATRRYAKRQRTWFRSNMREWTPVGGG